jgi:tetratricopeptide (TPR) repeat protein
MVNPAGLARLRRMMRRPALAAIICSVASPALADAKANCADTKAPADQIIAACTKVVQADAKASWAYLNRGIAYAPNDSDAAIADYTKAIESDPSNSAAYMRRASSYIFKTYGKLIPEGYADIYRDLAISDLDKVIALDPGNSSAHNERGRFYVEMGELDRAIKTQQLPIMTKPLNWAAGHSTRSSIAALPNTAKAI